LWQNNQFPNRFWAGRYVNDFDLAFEFLGKSIEASEDIDAQDDAQDLRVPVEYDVFLSYNSHDKPAVEAIGRRLTDEAGLRVFLDIRKPLPETAWQVELAAAIERSANAAVFFGPEEPGAWANEELRLLLDRSVRQRDDFRVIPVLLPGADAESLPYLLRDRIWVDFRASLDDTEAFRRLLAGVRGQAIGGPSDQLPNEPIPYRGLAPFYAGDARFFFGRDSEISKLMRNLVHSRFVAVVGATGCGKSSLVNAGLWTETASKRLQKENYPPISDWHILQVRPGSESLESIAAALASQFSPSKPEDLSSSKFVDAIRHSDEGLLSIIANVFSNDDKSVLIVVDQFEELFTLAKDSPDNVSNTSRFINNLLGVVHSKNSRLHIIVTLRLDFLDRCFAYRGLLELLQSHMILLGNLSRESLRQAILLPAQRVGALFEKGLLEIILRDFANQTGSLPFLQQSLKELWDRRSGPWLTVEAYKKMGGLGQALALRAETTFKKLTLEQQSVTRFIFGRLITGSECRKRVDRTELYPAGQPQEDIDEVIFQLSRAVLIVCTDQTVEIAHEALIYAWPRLRHWLDEDREFLLWRERLGTLLTEWQGVQRSEEALLRGPLLIEAQKWFDQRSQDLSDQEREFISASCALRERLTLEERQRQEHELQAAQKLARTEAERADHQAKAAARLRGFVVAMVVLCLLTIMAAFFAQLQRQEAVRQAQMAERARLDAEQAIVATQKQEGIATALRLAYASSALLDKDLQTSLLLAVEAVKLAEATKVRVAAAEQSLVDALGSNASRLLAQGESKIYSVATSPDARRLVTGSADGTARLWDLTAKDPAAYPVVLRGHEGAVTTVAISPDNRWLVTGSFDKTVRLWDLSAEDLEASQIVLLGNEGAVTAVAISPDARWLMTGSEDDTARLWDLTAKDPAANPVELVGHKFAVTAVAISPDNRRLITGSEDGTARLWDLAAKDPAANPVVLFGHKFAVTAVAISPDARRLVTGSADGTARLWDLTAKDPAAYPAVLRGHEGAVTTVAISPDNRWLVTGSLDETARLWDLAAKDPAASSIVLRGQEGGITAIAISPDASWLVTGSEDHTARLWDLTAKDPTISKIVLRSQQGAITAVAISADNHWLVSGSSDGTARLWTLRVSELIRLARSKVNRNLTTNEWRLYFPGEKYRKTFPDLPGPD
jgi:WD40 repeat protein